MRWASALIAAAAEAGIRLTLLDTCYLRGGIGVEVDDIQRRFSDGDAVAWATRASELADGPGVRIGAAIHSVRAVDPAAVEIVAAWAAERGAPLHAHVSEQPAENEQCVGTYGRSPTQLLADRAALERPVHRRARSPHERRRPRPARCGGVVVLPVPDDRTGLGRRHRSGAGLA